MLQSAENDTSYEIEVRTFTLNTSHPKSQAAIVRFWVKIVSKYRTYGDHGRRETRSAERRLRRDEVG